MVITGVNIGRYSNGNTNFDDLIEQILEIPGDFRVRISSIEPDGFSDKFLSLFQNPKLCPHLHLCLQSGSDHVLINMRRMYTIGTYLSMVEKLRVANSLFNFSTDIIVGFPGETEEDFKQSVKVAKDVGFSHIHTFKYSERKNTRAERMPNKVPGQLKTERSEVMRQLSGENKLAYYKKLIGAPNPAYRAIFQWPGKRAYRIFCSVQFTCFTGRNKQVC
ncbi:MAG: radical SAM protein [Bacteroidales bacterium]|nr:radical SAM protein [Bacteroidales bacterium]